MKTRKFLAMLLVLCMLVTATPYSAPVHAAEERLAQEQTQEQTQPVLIDAPLLAEDTCLPTRANSTFFKYVDEATFTSANHVARIPSEETTSTYVFRNADGTKTVYYLSDNVKFVTADGQMVEKDLTLVAKDGGYGVSRSDIDYLLPTSAASGIRLQHGAKEVTLIPQAQSGRVAAAAISGDSVRYANYFGSGIHLVYTPLPSGLKEDIVLDRYTGQYSFTFTLNTNGMRPYMQDNQYYLATSADSEERIYLGEVVVYDAKGEPSPGTLTITTVTMGQQYQITVSADPAFLTNPNTEYPVTIDPSLTISDSTQSGAIEDASIYGNKPTVNAGTWTYNHCGYYTSSSTVYGVSRTVYRLAGLINDTTWASIDPADIVSAKLYVKEASGTAGATINLHALTNTTWTETGVNWNNIGDYNTTTVFASSAPGYGAWGEWDITGLARAWKYLTRNINAGFILVSADETANSKTLYASEYGTVDRRPYFTVTYNYDTDGLSSSVINLVESHTAQLTWPGVDAQITWSSSNSSIAHVTNTGIVTGVKAGTATISATAAEYGTKTCTVYVTIADGVYYIRSSTNLYLGTSGSIAENTSAILQAKATSGFEQIRQLWKIKYIANGYYSIRPMNKLDMGLHVTSSSVDVCTLGSTDTLASVTSPYRWTIVYDSTGYTFRQNGSTSQTIRPKDSGAYPGLEIITGSYTGGALFRWQLERVLTPPTTILLYDTTTNLPATNLVKYIAPNETRTLSDLGITAAFVSGTTNNQSVSMTSAAPTQVSANTTSITGLVPMANTTVSVQKTYNGQVYSQTISVNVTALAEGIYYIRNDSTGRYVDIQDQGEYTSDGSRIVQWSFHGGNTQKWKFIHLGDGTYSIQSYGLSTPFYMGVPSNNVVNREAVVLRDNVIDRTTKWIISMSNSGVYSLTLLASQDDGLELSLDSESLDMANYNGLALVMRFLEDEVQYRGEWQLLPVHSYAYITLPARIYYDSTCAYSSTRLSEDYNRAVADFLTNFNIKFELQSVALATALDCSSSCHAPNLNSGCTAECAENSLCSLYHHRSGSRLTDILTSNSYYTFRMVGYGICFYYEGDHSSPFGVGTLNGKDSIASTILTDNLIRTIQHELSHNLGASHDTCISGQPCILDDHIGKWCDACAAAIRANYSLGG